MKFFSFVIGLILVLFSSLTYGFSTSGMDGPVRKSGQGRSGITTSGMGGVSSGASGTQYAKLSPSPQEQQLERRINEIRKRVERMPEEPRKPDKKTVARPAPAPKPATKGRNPYVGTISGGYLQYYEEKILGWLDDLHNVTSRWDHLTRSIADVNRVERRLVRAMMAIESRGNPEAVSPKGAVGLMQLMPKTSQMMNVKNPENPVENVRGGVRYLRYLYEKLGSWENAILGYMEGEKGAKRFLRKKKATDHPYVRRVYAMYELHG